MIDKVLDGGFDQACVNTGAVGNFGHVENTVDMRQKLLSSQIPFVRIQVIVLARIHVYHEYGHIPIINVGWIGFGRDH